MTVWLSPLSQLKRVQLTSWVKLQSDFTCSGELDDDDTYHYLQSYRGAHQILSLTTTLSDGQIIELLEPAIDYNEDTHKIIFDFFIDLMAIPKHLIEDSIGEERKDSEVDNDNITFTLCEVFGYTPKQVAEMTEVQQLILLRQLATKLTDKEVSSNKLNFATEEEYNEWRAANYHNLNK